MSNKRYLEFDSTYRNRNEYPLPSSFTVLIGQSGTRNAANAYDPISNAAPLISWVPDQLVLTGGTIIDPNPLHQNNLNTLSELTIQFPSGTANTYIDYYNGAPILPAQPIGLTVVYIKSWNLFSSDNLFDYFTVGIAPTYDTSIFSGNVIFFPSTDLSVGSFLIPYANDLDNYYNGYLIYNERLNEYRTIISYIGSRRLAGLDLSKGSIVSAGWTKSDTYTLRKSPPQFTGQLDTTIPPKFVNSTSSFFIPLNTLVSVGDFIRFTGGPPHGNISCRVISLDVIKSGPLDIPPPPFQALSVTVDCILDPIPTAGTTFEVLQFTRDNVVPFSYTGSIVSQQEMVCYEMRLINLIIPNILLKSGGQITSYPYLYVELQNVSASSAGTKNVIYSNNPNSHKMLFKAVIDYIEDKPYIQLSGGDMVQTVKFKPNDSLKFGVYLPDGRPLETIYEDYFSPLPPDPFVQISAMFEAMRL